MHIQLTIDERLTNEKSPQARKRIVTVTTDSVTFGSEESADVVLRSFGIEFLVEVKHSKDTWWIINPQRISGLLLNRRTVAFDSPLKHQDEIIIFGHRILFEVKQSALVSGPTFSEHPGTDELLWTYLLEEREFDEILINGPSHIFVDYRGVLAKAPWSFSSSEFLTSKIVENTKKSSGWASWRLHRTLRIQAALPPITEEPHLAIRKAKQKVLSLNELEESQFGLPDQIEFLRRSLKEKQNMIISGGTSTGKTVLLRSLIEQVDPLERLVIVEEEAETDWPHPHAVAIESGRGNLRQAVVECLRMRPNRLIVSEVRGPEAFDLLQAMNTGHAGSLSTIHANSPREALSRLENLALSAGIPLTVSAIRRQLATAVNIIVQLARDDHGQRRIEQIIRVSGIQNDTLLLSDPVSLEPSGLSQSLAPIRQTKRNPR